MPQGTVIKCMAIYDEPFWRDDGLSGQATSDAGPVKVDLRQLAAGRLARRAARLPRGQRRAASSARLPPDRATSGGRSDCFARFFGPRGRRARAYVERTGPRRSGPAAATAATCPPAHGPTSAPALREPIGPLHWAGAERATVWNGYMDGAVGSGQETAARSWRGSENTFTSGVSGTPTVTEDSTKEQEEWRQARRQARGLHGHRRRGAGGAHGTVEGRGGRRRDAGVDLARSGQIQGVQPSGQGRHVRRRPGGVGRERVRLRRPDASRRRGQPGRPADRRGRGGIRHARSSRRGSPWRRSATRHGHSWRPAWSGTGRSPRGPA